MSLLVCFIIQILIFFKTNFPLDFPVAFLFSCITCYYHILVLNLSVIFFNLLINLFFLGVFWDAAPMWAVAVQAAVHLTSGKFFLLLV